ncbi:MAG: DUF333 domain-containing protein [Patescibacteria group bacterium]|nr:DUF333 domain-containing protein [Patescibacteria group bacterium]MDD5164001.1 DUF333 domain-containing protein [Patescibacteria group bacterium]MDD5534915.1 DUF333 domain-containing protein [Patescibacteria group bacterium]
MKLNNKTILIFLIVIMVIAVCIVLFSFNKIQKISDQYRQPNLPKTQPQTGLANPASVNCVNKGGNLEIKTDLTGGQYGLCVFSSGAKCEEWALFRGECGAENPNYCEQDLDCACGKNKTTDNCFYGQKEFVNTNQQCPDFCNGIAANLEIKCENYKCTQINKLNQKCTDYSVENCPTDCVVCPPCAECSSISCQSKEFCKNIGFDSSWYESIKHQSSAKNCEDQCGNGICEEVVCLTVGCPCAETKETCPKDCK